ncbi:hypothetical protein BGZ50_001282, partial [Haplosporangium sp. Z 11]
MSTPTTSSIDTAVRHHDNDTTTSENANTIPTRPDDSQKADNPPSVSTRRKSRRVVVSLPSAGHSLEDPDLHRPVPPHPWAPSSLERRIAQNGASSAQALLRRLETSATLWNGK